ncbi:uncharacterized protein LOC123318323 [Coccinella septempunctata]|uniref:uncharacterized protein LOC123318323 n=1 Tax=Coccinella septempunctata TaxID=41139 RepID=UPI001D08FB03|nr:uncharacterized protein LOC123318323 [Coccinella septempunctata]
MPRNYKMIQSVLALCLIFVISVRTDEVKCPKPEQLESKESFCYRNHVDILDRLYESSQSILNLAKKKLGREVVENEKVPEKCEYYQCILQELHWLNSKKYPIYDVIKTWVEENVVLSQGMDLLDRLKICNDALSNSTVQNLRFRGNLELEEYMTEEENDLTRKCEMDAEFLRCLSLQKGCPVFQYP